MMRLPLDPIWEYVHAENPNHLADMLGVSDHSVRRWMVAGIPFEQCDKLAVSLGLHPLLLWGAEWGEAEAADLAFLADKKERRNRRNAGYRANRRRRESCQ